MILWQPEVEFHMLIGYGVVDLVGIGFEIVFLPPTVLEISPFSMHEIGHVSYFRVTWQPEVEFNMFIG